ncbi:MAG: class D beta-lactamase [Bacteroidetes bacterium]|nr:class D beta-lactamase [Fibrella sp.]
MVHWLLWLPPGVTERPDLKRFFDARQFSGSFLLFDQRANRYTAYNYARCERGFLPASTFKIPNTLIGLETGVIADQNFVIPWDGKKRQIDAWNRDHTLESAFRASCVPYYQELARRVGLNRMQGLVKKMDYGRMDIGAENLDRFWLEGNSRISQRQEIDFLRRVVAGRVPFSARNRAILKKIMLMDSTSTYKLYGKTGLATLIPGLNLKNELPATDIGWFVGYIETGRTVYFFATNIEQARPVSDTFVPGRRQLTEDLLRELKILP